jgi:uncharacterized membrane protein
MASPELLAAVDAFIAARVARAAFNQATLAAAETAAVNASTALIAKVVSAVNGAACATQLDTYVAATRTRNALQNQWGDLQKAYDAAYASVREQIQVDAG